MLYRITLIYREYEVDQAFEGQMFDSLTDCFESLESRFRARGGNDVYDLMRTVTLLVNVGFEGDTEDILVPKSTEWLLEQFTAFLRREGRCLFLKLKEK